MLVTLHEWLVADGQMPVPAAGARLRVGLRAQAVQVDLQGDWRGTSPSRPADAGGAENTYRLGGVAGAPRDVLVMYRRTPERVAVGFPLSLGCMSVLAWVAPPRDDIVSGAVVAIHAELHVIADYEYDGFDLPDVRRNWRIRRVLRGSAPKRLDYLLDLEPEDV